MKSTILSSLVLFGTFTLAYVASERRTTQLSERDISLGHSGNYQFVNCNGDQSRLLATLLRTLYGRLKPVIKDAENSASHRSAAYETFLKDSSRARFVAELITNVTIGNAVYPASPPFSKGNPTFACATPGVFPLHMPDGAVVDAYTDCINTGFVASYNYPTPFIMLCPMFFQLEPYPPADACPTVTRRTNHFVRKPEDEDIAGSSIRQNQMWILFHEVVHYYLYAQPGYVMLRPEVYSINKAWKLSAADAWRNSANYEYYAYTMSAKCTDWVTLPENERELLEVGDVGPADPDDEVDEDIEDVVTVTSAQVTEPNVVNAG